MPTFLSTLIATLGASGIIALVAWTFRGAISTWFVRGIQHKYDRKLETLKGEITAQENSLRLAHQVLSDSASSTRVKRIEAFDGLWQSILEIRAISPGFFTLLDVITREETRDEQTIEKLADRASVSEVLESNSNSRSIEHHRPYVGELAWALFFAYRQITFRIVALHAADGGLGPRSWLDDNATQNLIGQILTKDEMKGFTSANIGFPSMVQSSIENRFLREMRLMLSGSGHSAEALEEARRIRSAFTALDK